MSDLPIMDYRDAARRGDLPDALAAIKKFPKAPAPVRAGELGDSVDDREYTDMLRIDFRDGDWTQEQYNALMEALV